MPAWFKRRQGRELVQRYDHETAVAALRKRHLHVATEDDLPLMDVSMVRTLSSMRSEAFAQ